MPSLSGSLPKGDANGLAAIAAELVEDPERVHVVIALVDCSKVTSKTDTGDVVPTVRVRRIEAIADRDDGQRLRMLLQRQYERRTGKTVLPFDLEQDLRAAFGDADGAAGT